MPKVPESLNSAAILDPPSCPLLLQSANSLAAGMLIKCKVSSVGIEIRCMRHDAASPSILAPNYLAFAGARAGQA